MAFYVYIMASRPSGTLYTGYTDDLVARIWQHKHKTNPKSFTAKYDIARLVWFEAHGSREEAWIRERRIKEWKRAWKIALIEALNPRWDDLYDQIFEHQL